MTIGEQPNATNRSLWSHPDLLVGQGRINEASYRDLHRDIETITKSDDRGRRKIALESKAIFHFGDEIFKFWIVLNSFINVVEHEQSCNH